MSIKVKPIAKFKPFSLPDLGPKIQDALLKYVQDKGGLGLHLDEEWISLIYLTKEASGQIKPVCSLTIPTPGAAVKNGVITNPQAVAEIIKQACQDNGIRTRKIAVTVSKPDIVTNILELPEMAPSETQTVLRSEVDRYLVFGGQAAVFDHYRIDKKQLCFIAAKRKIVTSILAMARQAELELVAIEFLPLSVLRLLLHDNPELYSQQVTLLMFVSSKMREINLVQNGVICFSRSLEEKDQAVFIHEVAMTTDYWNEQFPTSPIKKALVVADMEGYKGIYQELSRACGVEVEEISTDLLNQLQTGLLCSGGAAGGAALRRLKPASGFDIDLTPPEALRRKRLRRHAYFVFLSSTAVLVAWFIVNIALVGLVELHHRKIALVQKELAGSVHILTDLEKINQNCRYLSKALKEKKSFIGQLDIIPWLDILDDLKGFIPDGVWLDELNTTKEEVILTGKAYSHDAAYRYANLLRYSKYFNEPKITLIRAIEIKGDNLVSFTLTCPLGQEDEASP